MSNSRVGPYFNTPAAAIYLGVQPSTLRAWRQKGDGPAYVRFGNGKRKTVRYTLSALEIFVFGYEVSGTGSTQSEAR